MIVRFSNEWGLGDALYKYCTGVTREVSHEVAEFRRVSCLVFSQQGLL